MKTIDAFDVRDRIAKLKPKLLLIRGMDDPGNPPEYEKEIHEAVLGSQYVKLHGAGHFPPTEKPEEVNALIEKSVKAYEERMRGWIDVALEEGVRLFITALGNPRWVVDRVHAVGGLVYHDVTERRWAMKALDGGVDGLICVNDRAGGHAGGSGPQSGPAG